MYRFCSFLNGHHCQPLAGHQKTDSVFCRVKQQVRMRGFEPPRDYLPLGPQPSASANSATSACELAIAVCDSLNLRLCSSSGFEMRIVNPHH